MLTGLAPLVSNRTRLLILGSFPGAASLSAQQYYAHPQNQFWRILQAIWPFNPMDTGACSYEIRSDWLLARGLGLWDVYAACEREGSLDARIRAAQLNDFAGLARCCPQLQAIAHNGGESFKHAPVVRATLDAGLALDRDSPGVSISFHKLPSTSPAHAAMGFERKLDAWRTVFETHGLV